MKATCCVETPGSINPATQRRIPHVWQNRMPSCEQHPSGKRENLKIEDGKRVKGKGKAIPVKEVKVPRFQDTWHMKEVTSALRTGRLYHRGNIPGNHFC